MKKILHIATGLLIAVLFAGCDVNEQFDGLDEMTKPTNLAKYNYQLVDADYKTISDRALKLAGDAIDSAAARSINTNKYFTVNAPASVYVGLLLNTKYPYADLNSTANITYAFGEDKPAYISELGTVNILNTADYQSAWGSSTAFVSAFTPTVNAADKLPAILNAKFPTAVNGQYKFIEYNYSSVDATSQSAEVVYFSETWENHTAATSSPYTPIGEGGWINKDVLASLKWYCRVFSSNKYAQVSSNNSGAINEAWMVSPQIDLANAVSPLLTFNINVGYWNANCLSVWVSENFNGTEAGIQTATWVDISSNFTFPQTPTNAYGTLAPAGQANLSAYAGKKVYVAFKYVGDGRSAADRGTDPLKTTTYQVDNVKVSEVKVTLAVPSTVKQYVAYKKNAGTWTLAEDTFVSLQASDYSAMGLTFISSTQVPLYIPAFLKEKFPYAQEGAVKTVIFKSGSNQTFSAAKQYKLTSGAWIENTFKVNKTEQFIYSNDGWLFDPTINMEMVVTDYKIMVDYILAHSTLSIFAEPTYQNEEFYYGFGSRYSNVSFRLSYRDPFYFAGRPYQQPASIDAELYALTNTADKVALMWNRLQAGMGIFLQLRFPEAIPQVSGVDVYYNVKVKVYTPDGVTSSLTEVYNYKFKCTAAGSSGVKPTFEFISKTKV